MFGGHVEDLALGHARLGLVFLDATFGDTKIREFHFAFATKEDIIGAEIAVNEMEGLTIAIGGNMGVVKTFEDINNDGDTDGKGQRDMGDNAAMEQIGKAEAIDVLHDDIVGVFCLAEVIDANDIGVLEACNQARLVDKHLDVISIAGDVRVKSLDGDFLLETLGANRAPQEDFSHPAVTDLIDHFVLFKMRFDRHAHAFTKNERVIFLRFSKPNQGDAANDVL